MTKIVINKCYGGFGLSEEGVLRYLEIKGQKVWPEYNKRFNLLGPTYWLVPPGPDRVEEADDKWHSMTMEEREAHNDLWSQQVFYDRDVARDDPVLAQVVEELGDQANGRHANLKVVEIPNDVKWCIEEYDGTEWVSEVHRTWE